jgi:hypothetical protein
MTCWVYIQSETGPDPLWTVGFFDPKGNWIPESDHGTSEEAAIRAHWLNGGDTFVHLNPAQDDDAHPIERDD